jgi:type II restriction/modification system DNA methylase subunit YeeA
MTPQAFISKWLNSPIKERAAAQAHFLDMCAMLGEPTPAEVDPSGLDYGFEVGATKTTGGRGFADVFKRGFFALEYKGLGANLEAAFAQLQRYAVALDNPPLLIVSDVGSTIRIHTNWTNSVSKVYEIAIADLGDPEKRAILKAAFSDPEALRPKKTRQEVTEEVATEFAALARSLRGRGHAPEKVAHFINRLVFCMFAEDVKLLPDAIFTRMLDRAIEEPAEFETFASDLFTAMKAGGRVGFERIAWFNGGLFDDDLVIALTKDEIKIVKRAALQYWGDIDPSILGTLFERGLDPDKRSQLGAHYTDRDKIMMIINPVIVEPLTAEWEAAKTRIEEHMAKAAMAKGGARTKAIAAAQAGLDGYLKRLSDFRVLDPACGSGNFLYLALRSLKDLEHRAQVEAEALGLPRTFPRIGPEVVKGIEINPYAAELARVSVWIGEIQWMLKNGFAAGSNPVLKPLDNIECRDALLTRGDDGQWREAEWPAADAIVGNPPFLGDKLMRNRLGTESVDALRKTYSGRLPGGADLVCYWFEKARAAVAAGTSSACGLVSTNSIRGGANRTVLDRILADGQIFNAWADEAWVVDGAAVRVSLVCFQDRRATAKKMVLDGEAVDAIHGDLTALSVNLTLATALPENESIAFIGNQKGGAFDIDGELARQMLIRPTNPNGRRNSDVVVPWINGLDIVRRPRDNFIIDFTGMTETDAALYEAPFSIIAERVRPYRTETAHESSRDTWWLHQRPRPSFREAVAGKSRFIGTARVAKHRVFVWVPTKTVPDSQVVAIARDDDTSFGVLHSRFHEQWSLRMGTALEDRPRYTPTTTFETFPFPEGLTPNVAATDYASDPRAIAIAEAAKRLNELRENWLNPADLVRREPEVVPGFPDRVIPVDEAAANILQKRTLTNLYNERPAWLAHAHEALDKAVAAAYGWPAHLNDEEVLGRLFALNQERASTQ